MCINYLTANVDPTNAKFSIVVNGSKGLENLVQRKQHCQQTKKRWNCPSGIPLHYVTGSALVGTLPIYVHLVWLRERLPQRRSLHTLYTLGYALQPECRQNQRRTTPVVTPRVSCIELMTLFFA